MSHRLTALFCVVLVGFMLSTVAVQATIYAEGDGTPAATQAAAGQRVQIKAEDGLQIVGMFYATADKAPAVVLLHDGVSTRSQWEPFVADFVNAGYNVLNIDQRGFGETGKGTESAATTGDVHDQDLVTVAAWLGEQSSVEANAIAFVGARLGANYAIRACAKVAQCHTVVALSPAIDYFGIKTLDAIKGMGNDKALFLVAGQLGENGAVNIKQMQADAPAGLNILTRIYGINLDYGTKLFSDDPSLMPMVMMWLKTYNHA